MRKFLSLVLALAMAMSLVVVNTSAKEFTDSGDLNYKEAVDVISEIGVVDGYADGSFNPQGGLTRGAAAKIICNLILGPTTAAELRADTRPFSDVAVDSEFAGYIAYCAQQGIISGYADGEFKAANPLTGYAFMKMLLGALGYSSDIENYVGENWSINVAKQALGIGLNTGLVDEFNGVDYVTREEAALYAFNTLKATMVDYDNTITADVNGASVTISNNTAKPVTWSEGRNNDGNIKDDGFVQFAEEFFPDLVRKDDNDKFMAPANTWLYNKTEIGTYERTDLLVESYTTGVTGRDAYDLLKSGVISDNDLEAYLDGVNNMKEKDANMIGKDDLVRSNDDDLPGTGNGVLTKVYLDTDKDLITIVSINTWLAKATADYNDSKEYAPLSVYTNWNTTKTYNVDVEEVENVADVTKDTYYQVNISYKDNSNGEVIIINDVEVLEDSTVSKFSAENGTDSTATSRYVTKLTTGGEEYSRNVKAYYDKDVLDTYNETLLTDNTYNVYLDQYGYFLGVDLFEGTKNYVFITGFDRNSSNLSVKTATAGAIFLDGSMKNIEVNVTDTDKNIDKLTASDHNEEYFKEWSDTSWQVGRGVNGVYNLNQWYTYTVDESGTYTLKPATRMTWTKYPMGTDVALRTDNLSVVDSEGENQRVYGEDATVFLTVDLDIVDTTNGIQKAITDVTGVYTGVQNVDIDVDVTDPQAVQQGQVFTVYDSDWYVIGAVVIGEARGSTANYAYITSTAKSEELRDGTYYWTFEAVLGGEHQTLTAKSKYASTINALTVGTVQELRFDGDYVVSIKDLDNSDVYTNFTTQINKQDVYFIDGDGKDFDGNTLTDVAGTGLSGAQLDTATELTLQGRTLYVTANRTDVGLGLASDAKAVTIQTENNSTKYTNFTDVTSALSHLADANVNAAGLQYDGKVVAILNSNGVAEWVVFVNKTALTTGNQGGQGAGATSTEDTVNGYNVNIALVDHAVTAGDAADTQYIANRAAQALVKAGYKNAMPVFLTNNSGSSSAGTTTGYVAAYDQNNNMLYFTVTYTNYWTIKVDGRVVETVMHNDPAKLQMKDVTGAGEGFVKNGTYYSDYATTSTPVFASNITSASTVETGYVSVATPTTPSYGSLAISGGTKVTDSGVDYYKASQGFTVTFTTAGSGSASADQRLTLNVNGSAYGSVQTMTQADYNAASKTVSWTVVPTADVTAITLAAANVPASRTIDYTSATPVTSNGVTFTVTGVTSAMDGETITLTVQISGTATGGDADVSISGGDTGSGFNMSSFSNGVSLSGGKLTVAEGGTYNTAVEYNFVVGPSNTSVTMAD